MVLGVIHSLPIIIIIIILLGIILKQLQQGNNNNIVWMLIHCSYRFIWACASNRFSYVATRLSVLILGKLVSPQDIWILHNYFYRRHRHFCNIVQIHIQILIPFNIVQIHIQTLIPLPVNRVYSARARLEPSTWTRWPS